MNRLWNLFEYAFAMFFLLLYWMGAPAYAGTGTSQIVFGSFLTDLLQLVVTVAVIVALALIRNVAAVHNNKTLSDTLTKLAWDAAHFGLENADARLTTVRGIAVKDPVIATAANWLLNAADSEIKGLHLSDVSVLDAVAAIVPQAKAALVSSQPASTEGKS